jgi:leucyl-tRNA synthetase
MAKYWADNKTFAAHNNSEKPNYVTCFLIHLVLVCIRTSASYIASDVYSDIKTSRIQCFASYGYDSFGLPAEQYAIQTGQRPEDTTRVLMEVLIRRKQNCRI